MSANKRPYSSMSESSTSDFPPSPASLELEEFDDPNLKNAMLEATRTNTVTPIIKQEIRYAIQNKRLKHGKEELVVSLTPKAEIEELSQEDIIRRELRRNRNKIAAQKCRHKRKAKADTLVVETQEYEEKNKKLMVTINNLEEEKNRLLELLTSHTTFCLDQASFRAKDIIVMNDCAKKPRCDSVGTLSTTSYDDTEEPISVLDSDSDGDDSSCTTDKYIPQGNLLATIDTGDLW